MRIRIDAARCTGHGLCYAAAPALVTDDERGYGQVVGTGEVAPDQVAAAERAVARCPEGAVAIDPEP